MPRCRKILANGKRCKAHAISGSKFCLFHTPNQPMKRGHKVKRKSEIAGRNSKSVTQTTIENQIAMRGSRKLGALLVASGLRYMARPDYQVIRTNNPARINRQGTVYVSAHQRRVIEPTRSDGGRGFHQTDNPKRKREQARTRVQAGRLVPYLGIGYMLYNLGTNPSTDYEKPTDGMESGFGIYDAAKAGHWAVKNTVKAGIVSTLTGGVFDAADAVGAVFD